MINLKLLSKDNVTFFYKWINDKEVIKYSLSLFQKINSELEIKKWFSNLINNKENLQLGIYLKEEKKLIGYAGICDIYRTNKSGEYFIFIGDEKYWGKGISTQVTKEILRIGFNDMKLHRIMLTVYKQNIGGLKSYKKAGFIEEVVLRDVSYRDNKYHDKIVMSVLKPQCEKK